MIADAVRRSLPALLVLHALRAAFAFAALGPLYRELAAAMDRSTFHATASPLDAAIALEVISRAFPRMLPGALAAVLAYGLLGPWLQQALLHVLAGASLRAAVLRALRRYPAALAARLTALLAFAVLAVILVLTIETALGAVPASPTIEGLVRALFVATGLVTALGLCTWHDLVTAAVARGAGLQPSLRSSITRCTRAALRRHLLALATASALIALGELASRIPLPLSYALGPGVVLAVQQALLFAALAARAGWLAHALTLAAPSAEPTRPTDPPQLSPRQP